MNYYLGKDVPCPTCGAVAKVALHIGKQCYGWRFLFQAHEDPPLHSWADYQALLQAQPEVPIMDECEGVVSREEFVAMVNRAEGKVELFRDDYLDSEGYPFVRGEFS